MEEIEGLGETHMRGGGVTMDLDRLKARVRGSGAVAGRAVIKIR